MQFVPREFTNLQVTKEEFLCMKALMLLNTGNKSSLTYKTLSDWPSTGQTSVPEWNINNLDNYKQMAPCQSARIDRDTYLANCETLKSPTKFQFQANIFFQITTVMPKQSSNWADYNITLLIELCN